MKRIRFIISIFGDRHVNMLMPLLFSIKTSCPHAYASIYWEEIKNETKSIIKKGFPEFDFIDTDFNFKKDVTKRISSKIIAWEFAANHQRSNSDWLLFIDADTLVVKDPLPLLNKVNADIIITHRNESAFWINTGVLVCKKRNNVLYFFTKWREETQKIIKTPELFAKANNKNFPYGGADQMSLQKLINYSKIRDTFEFQHLVFKSMHCRFLNETYSRPITKDTHIIHYKGGWRDIIFFGSNFTRNRTKKDSWEMYILYLHTFVESVQAINKKIGTSFTVRDFGLIIPFYINTKTWEEYKTLYPLHVFVSYVRAIPRRLWSVVRDVLSKAS